jgi:hypothetical protein
MTSTIPRRLLLLLIGTASAAVAVFGQAAADAEPIGPGNVFVRSAYDSCAEQKLNQLQSTRPDDITIDDLNGIIYDCCLVAGGDPTYPSGGMADCPDVTDAREGLPPVKLSTRQQGVPPVMSAPPTPTKPTKPGGSNPVPPARSS